MMSNNQKSAGPAPLHASPTVNNTTSPHCAYFLSNSPDWRGDSPAWRGYVETTYLAALDVYPRFINDATTKPMRCAVCGTTRLWGEGELIPLPHLPKTPELLPSVFIPVCSPCMELANFEAFSRAGDNLARTIKNERGLA